MCASKVPFVNLRRQYEAIQTDIDKTIQNVFEESIFSNSPSISQFEEQFASAHGVPYAIALNSGSAALFLGLVALGIGPGDEVIVPANTFFATAAAVSLVGAIPVFADCHPQYYTLNPSDITPRITSKTKAIMPVHLYGQAAPMAEIMSIAKQHGLYVIEDCAQGHFAKYQNQVVGQWGDIGCFSFYPTKNLGAFGEGGAVITRNDTLAKKIRMLRNNGSEQRYVHDEISLNYRLETMQAAILKTKLNYVNQWTEARRRHANQYHEQLKSLPMIMLPTEQHNSMHVYHLFVVQVENRTELQSHLKNHGVDTLIHYPIPCHLQKAFDFLKYKKDSLPVCEKLSEKILSLPLYPELTPDEIQYVCNTIHSFYKE